MSSSNVNLSSDHSDSQGYARDTPANQEFVAESQMATPTEIALQEAGLTKKKKKKKKTLIKEVNISASSGDVPRDKAASSKGGMDKRVPKASTPLIKADRPKFPLTDEFSASLEKLRRIFRNKEKRPIAFKKVKLVKKVPTSADLLPRPTPFADLASHSSPALVESTFVPFSPPVVNLAHESLSPYRHAKRPSKGGISQGKEKQAKATSEFSDLPKGGIPPSPFLAFDPLMASGFYTIEFLTPPYTLPGEGLCEGYSQSPDPLEVFGAMCRHLIQAANPGFELARRADRLEEENKYLQTRASSGKTASL
ncbi:hypothetical protein LIER_33171 [Lithospermum erythrorhizon]|uniref:Uncharacterized protein n=1 Tax=Lithospermum erythrorhizon TaxID=34254 RepID=A0AAV3RW05_LITER